MLDALDRQIIHLLTIEPRASFRVIAEVTGISDQTAARRYRKLSESAELRVLGVVNGPRAGWIDWFVQASTPEQRDALFLRGLPGRSPGWPSWSGPGGSATGRWPPPSTGPTNVVATAIFRGTQHLYEYLTGPLAALPGVISVETGPIIRTLKRTGAVP